MHLDFANPALLGALALAALPLIIHLISRRVARDQRFAALAFIRKASKRRSRNIRLRQLLLLLLRTLLIALLVLAMSQLLLRPDQAPTHAQQARSLYICLDASASMQTRTEDGRHSLFELAKQRAQQAIKKLDPELPAWLIVAGSKLQPLLPEPGLDHRRLLDALDGLRAGPETSDLGACVNRVLLQLGSARSGPPARILVISDGAAHAWTTLPDQGQAQIELLRVPKDEPAQIDNYALYDAQLRPSTTQPRAVDVSVSVRYSGVQEEARSVPVTLKIADRVLSVVTAQPLPGSPLRKRFMQIKLPDQAQQGLLHFSLPPDRLPLDDQLVLPVELPRRLHVLVVDGDPQSVHYRDEIFYLDRALREEHPGSAPLLISERNAGQLSSADLAEQDVVILANVAQLPGSIVQDLSLAVRAGTGLLISAGDNIDADYYNRAFAGLLPARLRGQKDEVRLEQPKKIETQRLQIVDSRHPLLRALGAKPGLSRAQTRSVLLIEPDPKVQRVDILRFSGGTPALCERRVGQGRVMLLATSIDRDWSDLAIRPGFLPLIQQIVVYLADAMQIKRRRAFVVGASVPLPVLEDARALVVTSPSGSSVRLTMTDKKAPRFTQTRETGLYQLSVELDDDSTRPLPDWRFVVHIDPRESDSRLLDSSAFAQRLPAGLQVRDASPPTQQQRPLWPWLLLTLVLVFAFESWLTWKKR